MKNTFGTSLTVTLFGESHGAEIGAVIDGLSAAFLKAVPPVPRWQS